ncbi:MAG: GDYXXLXY domain-containing protein [Verrucomicrobiota bacterium]
MKSALLILWLAVVAGVLGYLVWQKEQTVAQGRTVLLELAPRDPRSLMQGDYMVLRYSLAQDMQTLQDKLAQKGLLVLKLDERGVAKGLRLHQGEALAPDEQRLIYRDRQGLRIGAESFFFQEGDAALYEKARYGELKVDAEGNSVLTGLRDAELQPLGQPVIR